MEYFDFSSAMLDNMLSEDAGAVHDSIRATERRDTSYVSQERSSFEYPLTADDHVQTAFNISLDERPVACEFAPAEPPLFQIPSVACNNCWLRELQCLIIRDTEDGCSSCKALSQPCSIATNLDLGVSMDPTYATLTQSIASQSYRGTRKGSRRQKGRSSPVPCRRVFNGILQTLKDDDTTDMSIQNMSPIDRWRHSPPETEPAALSAISNALGGSELLGLPLGNLPNFASPSLSDCHRSSSSLASSCSVFQVSSTFNKHGESTDSDISQESIHSSFSSYCADTLTKLEKRRGRRRRSKSGSGAAKALDTDGPSACRRFECTFCSASFRTRFDWSRHENTQHLSLESWICCRFGTTTLQKLEQLEQQQPSSSGSIPHPIWTALSTEQLQRICIFCRAPTPDGEHLQQLHSIDHGMSSCNDDDVRSRTFYRKDHLIQHLRLVHNCTFQADTMTDWRVEINEVVSRCGFCAVSFEDWSVRRKHLGQHFRAGARMREWKGGWGLARNVEQRLENIFYATGGDILRT